MYGIYTHLERDDLDAYFTRDSYGNTLFVDITQG